MAVVLRQTNFSVLSTITVQILANLTVGNESASFQVLEFSFFKNTSFVFLNDLNLLLMLTPDISIVQIGYDFCLSADATLHLRSVCWASSVHILNLEDAFHISRKLS